MREEKETGARVANEKEFVRPFFCCNARALFFCVCALSRRVFDLFFLCE